jgi:RNA polymerase sigma factor (sigma-70 family)
MSKHESREPADRTLLEGVSQGQPEAAAQLYERYARRLIALAARRTGRDLAPRLDPEDVLQSVFRTFFRRAARGEYHLPEGSDLWGLLAVIAMNKIRAKGAYHRAAIRSVSATTGEEGLEDLTAEDVTALSDLQIAIEEILAELPESQRTIVRHRISGDQVAEIARKTARSKRSVERAIHEFCERLRGMLAPEAP